MRVKQLLAIALPGLLLIPALPPKPANANPAAAVIAACGAQPEICAIVGAAAGTWILWNSGRHYWCTAGQCQPTRRSPYVPNESRVQFNESGKVEVHAVAHPNLCKTMEQRFIMQGRSIRLHRIRRTTNPMLRYECEFVGDDAVEGWFT